MNRDTQPTSCLSRGLTLLLTVLFVISTLLAVMFLTIELILLQPHTYQQALERQGLYDRLPELLAGQITYQAESSSGENTPQNSAENPSNASFSFIPSFMRNLDRASWQAILSAVLPREWMQTQSESLIEQGIAAVKTADQPHRLVISYKELREQLSQEKLQQVAAIILQNAPVCSEEQLYQITLLALGQTSGNPPVCIPLEELKPFIQQMLTTTLQGVTATIPEEAGITFTLISQETGEESTQPSGAVAADATAGAFSKLDAILLLSPLVPFFLLLLLVLLSGRSWYALSRRLGPPLAASGLLLLLPAAAALLFSRWLLGTFLVERLTRVLTLDLAAVMGTMAQQVSTSFLFWIGLQAGLLFLIGSSLLVLSVLFKPHPPSQPW